MGCNEDKVIHNKLKYEGKVFKTNNCGDMVIVCYNDYKRVNVKFLETGYETVCELGKILQGKVKDKLSPTVHGNGVVGDLPVRDSDGIVKTYLIWSNMLKRCYDNSFLKSRPSYKDCTVSDGFKYYPYFKEWCEKQVGFNSLDDKGRPFHLDKDILIKGNKVYSEDTCCFVPNEINSLLLNHSRGRGKHPVGVSYHKPTGSYRTTLNRFGQNLYLGLYTQEDEAFAAYKQAKEDHIKVVADKWKDHIDIRTYNALINWCVSIDD